MEVKIFKQGPYHPSKDMIDFSHWDSSLSQSSYCCLREMRKEEKSRSLATSYIPGALLSVPEICGQELSP